MMKTNLPPITCESTTTAHQITPPSSDRSLSALHVPDVHSVPSPKSRDCLASDFVLSDFRVPSIPRVSSVTADNCLASIWEKNMNGGGDKREQGAESVTFLTEVKPVALLCC